MNAATIPDDTGKPEVVKFQTNIPIETALKFDTGRPVQSQYSGDQVCFTLYDDRRMYVSPAVAAKIEELGIRRNDPFTICRRETRVGNRKGITWEIALVNANRTEGAVQAQPSVPAQATREQLVQGNHNSNGHGNDAHANGNGNDALERTGKAAIDAVLAVEAYARSKGLGEFAFGPDNIQRLWVTLFISGRNGGRI